MSADRARGALLGLAVGDALGTTLEFERPVAPAFPNFATGPHREVTGGGPFELRPGQVTDDTQMACCLAASLREHRRFVQSDVARRYAEWWPLAFDVGSQTEAALSSVSKDANEAGRAVWLARGRQAAGNGSLMRTAPIGVFFAGDPTARLLASLADSAITHYDPRCQLACAALNAALSAALGGASARDARIRAGAELEPAADLATSRRPDDTDQIRAAAASLRSDLEAADRDDPELYGPDLHLHRHEGFVRVAFRLAFWEAVHAPTFEAGLIDVVNRGGDADTNGAIAGSLLGALHGEPSIPERWRRTVLDALQDGPPGPWRDQYHPLALLELTAGA
ncbi:MAG: ADP-ribosylglycohydrolase family protein [Deltaproteobacteria bacterium]|nr:ADP-ribosylglycohydrolase family protein [Deltaproteobacteria bacterium]